MANVYAFRGASVNDTALSYNIRRKHMSCPTGRTGKILFPVFVPCRISGERAIQFYISFLKRTYFHTNSTIDTSYSINLRIKEILFYRESSLCNASNMLPHTHCIRCNPSFLWLLLMTFYISFHDTSKHKSALTIILCPFFP